MLGLHESRANEGRVADDEVNFGRDGFPVEFKGVGLADVGVTFQRQEVKVAVNNFARLLNHLKFGNPKGGLRYGHGEVVNLNAVELSDRNFNGIVDAEKNLVAKNFFEDFVFKSAEADETFREKIS